jgi:hypothetical protein
MDYGVAVRVTVKTPTQEIVVTDEVVRAAWTTGGIYDGGRSPWYTPTPNPGEVELLTGDPLWDPTVIGAYDVTPLASSLTVLLAENVSFPTLPDPWTSGRRFWGPIIGHSYEPVPGGGARVRISATDALTNLGDAVASERPEESPYDRLVWAAGLVKDLNYQFNATGQLAGPTLGRYHPDQGLTLLELMHDSALAAGQAITFYPLALDQPPPAKTVVQNVPQGRLGAPGSTWFAAVDPENGMSLGGYGGSPFLGANTLTACLTGVALARQELGYRTRIESARTVAGWYNQTYQDLSNAVVGLGTAQWNGNAAPWDEGDTWEQTLFIPYNNTAGTSAWRPFWWDGLRTSLAGSDQTIAANSATTVVHRRVSDRAMASSFMGHYWVQTGASSTLGAGSYRSISRLPSTGPTVATILTARETTYGPRAVTGWRSPIARQADLTAWNTRALGWVTQPTVFPRLFNVTTSVGHPSDGAAQWAVHVDPLHRVALRHTPQSTPDLPSIVSYVTSITVNLTATELAIECECGPVTANVD